jgi:hypothetical protein
MYCKGNTYIQKALLKVHFSFNFFSKKISFFLIIFNAVSIIMVLFDNCSSLLMSTGPIYDQWLVL